MKKFECTVTREDKYIIEIDENVLNDEWMVDFRKYFYSFHDLSEHAEHIAQFRARYRDNFYFIKGYGTPLVNGRKPAFTDENFIQKAINIRIVSEDVLNKTNVKLIEELIQEEDGIWEEQEEFIIYDDVE